MRIHLTKKGRVPVLSCIRDDGSVTYAKLPYGDFFPHHDLMHFAVETTLGMNEAFFGLIAAGWDITTFSETGTAHRLPLQAKHSEFMVGLLAQEHLFGPRSNSHDFSKLLASALRDARIPAPPPLRQDVLDALWARFESLLAEYAALAEGERMQLVFNLPPAR